MKRLITSFAAVAIMVVATVGLCATPAQAGETKSKDDKTEQKKGAEGGESEAAEGEKAPEKPKVRSWSEVVEGSGGSKFDVAVQFRPGVPDAEQLTEITLLINEIPKTPHPRFGRSVPLQNGQVVVELQNPIEEVMARYLSHQVPLSRGKYAVHITPPQSGMLGIVVKGRTASGKTFEANTKFPVDVWPLPAELMQKSKKSFGGRRRPVIAK